MIVGIHVMTYPVCKAAGILPNDYLFLCLEGVFSTAYNLIIYLFSSLFADTL